MDRVRSATVITLIAALAAVAILFVFSGFNREEENTLSSPQSHSVVPLAVLGDSDSHSYHDQVLIPERFKRGGKLRTSTWQWTEILARLRGRYVDQGEWGTWGTPVKIAEAMDWLDWGGRAPRKQDYQYNFAVSGAECQDLMVGYYRQAPRLLSLMNRAPEKWKIGIVSIRIGINNIGQYKVLDRIAKEGVTPAVRSEVLQCVDWIWQSVDLIRHSHPQTRFVLVGILNNADWPPNFGHWNTAHEQENISSALDLFDNAVQSIAERQSGIAFFDDRAWFRSYWGGRDKNGRPAYRNVIIGGRASIANTQGDEPTNAVVADGHAGVVWNALWTQQYIALLNSAFGLEIPPLSKYEISATVDPNGEYGLLPVP